MYSLGAEDGQLIKECARACRLLLGSSSAIKTISPLIIKHLDLNVMMAVVTQTLSSCLGARNPSLDVSRCSKKGGNTKSSKRTPYHIPRSIRAWEDFDYDALKTIYDGWLHHVLGSQLDIEQLVTPHKLFCKIFDEKSLESLISKWNQTVVVNALDATRECLKDSLPLGDIYMSLGGQAELPSKKCLPDWAGTQEAAVSAEHKADKPRNILPGDTKVSTKWTSAKIEIGPVPKSKKKVGWIESLGQIFTYCTKANARYGYFITDKELVVFRICIDNDSDTDQQSSQAQKRLKVLDPSLDVKDVEALQLIDKTPAERAKTNGVLEYKAIPWANYLHHPDAHDKDLTVNLALWWLHIMAAESSSIEEDYPPLKDAVWHTEPQSNDAVLVGRRLPHYRNKSPTIEASRGKRKRRSVSIEATISTEMSPRKRRMQRLPFGPVTRSKEAVHQTAHDSFMSI